MVNFTANINKVYCLQNLTEFTNTKTTPATTKNHPCNPHHLSLKPLLSACLLYNHLTSAITVIRAINSLPFNQFSSKDNLLLFFLRWLSSIVLWWYTQTASFQYICNECACVCMRACVCAPASVCVCLCLCMCMCIYMCMYAHTCIHFTLGYFILLIRVSLMQILWGVNVF